MGSLFGTLGIGFRALQADRGAIEVTSNNIANVNTAGVFARAGQPFRKRSRPIRESFVWNGCKSWADHQRTKQPAGTKARSGKYIFEPVKFIPWSNESGPDVVQ